MKLKSSPEDFAVTEVSSKAPTGGPYSLYELSKQSIGTLEALQVLQRLWNLAPKQLSHAGLKDRHAVTTQFITIRNGPRSDFETESFRLHYVGATPTQMEASDIDGNRFDIVLRSCSAAEAGAVQKQTQVVSSIGFPNYFDEQRFGSLGVSKEFIAAQWCRKDYEQATWLALAEHNRHDDATERRQKQILRDTWGDWAECKQQLDRSHRRSVVTYLVDHSTNFKKAFALINPQMRGLYLSAFQSAVWNRLLAIKFQAAAPESKPDVKPFHIEIGDAVLPFPVTSTIDSDLELPLPSARCKALDAPMRRLCDEALEPYAMTLPDMKLAYPRDRWFSRGLRQAMVVPADLTFLEADDDKNQGRRKLSLTFTLPRGCYATMLIKSVTQQGRQTLPAQETTEQKTSETPQ